MTTSAAGPDRPTPAQPTARAATAARAAGMIAARRRDSEAKRARVAATLDRMLAAGTPITSAQVAAEARVSTWLVYAPGIRERIQQVRTLQNRQTLPGRAAAASTAISTPPQPATAGVEDLRTDLALARAEITRLRAEHDHHQQQLRLALGARLDELTKADLAARVDELTRHNDQLATTLARRDADNQALRERVTDLEDDLAAARTSLRRLIRTQNLPPTPDVSPESR